MKSQVFVTNDESLEREGIKVSPGDILLVKNHSTNKEELVRVQSNLSSSISLPVIGASKIYKADSRDIRTGQTITTTSSILEIIGICDIRIEILSIKK